jgi:hypothetical protein
VASTGLGLGQVCAVIKRGQDDAGTVAYREEYPTVAGRRCGSALAKGWWRSSSKELRRDHGELLDQRWRRGGARWTRCREGDIYNGVGVRATRSCPAASAWCSSGASVGRMWHSAGRDGLVHAHSR